MDLPPHKILAGHLYLREGWKQNFVEQYYQLSLLIFLRKGIFFVSLGCCSNYVLRDWFRIIIYREDLIQLLIQGIRINLRVIIVKSLKRI